MGATVVHARQKFVRYACRTAVFQGEMGELAVTTVREANLALFLADHNRKLQEAIKIASGPLVSVLVCLIGKPGLVTEAF